MGVNILLSLTLLMASIIDVDIVNSGDEEDGSNAEDGDKGRKEENGFITQQLATTTGPAMQPAPPESLLPIM